MNVDNPEHITVLSLCTGYGGLELGLAGALQNPMRVIAVEVEAFALANLVAKAEEGRLAIEALWPDLRTFPAERFRGCFDFVLAGYPCQGESVAGKRLGKADPRWLWPHIARIVQAVEPVWCFFENVPGHLTLGFPEVYRSLRDMGYTVEAGLFTAAECGAPHRRQRLFILAHSTFADSARKRQFRNYISLSSSKKLADTSSAELSGRQGQQGNDAEKCQALAGSGGLWPARPGQLQYEWEEPRVVGNAECRSGPERGGKRKEHRGIRQTTCVTPSSKERGGKYAKGQQEAQSGVGLQLDGASSRVDRLRLLGNGVVPAQAERAFRYLWEQSQ